MGEVERLGQRLLQMLAVFGRLFPRFFRELVGKGNEWTLVKEMMFDQRTSPMVSPIQRRREV
jgi:hypothetical protein